MKTKARDIPRYTLNRFRPVHREEGVVSPFGYNQIEAVKKIEGFELFSSDGLKRTPMGPFRSAFYRVSLSVSGTLDMEIGLEQYHHEPRTLAFTFPNQIFSKRNLSEDGFGYYLLFTEEFLHDIIPAVKIADEFPFYSIAGTPVFRVEQEELNRMVDLILQMNEELQDAKPGRVKAIQLYLYLVLLEAKRSYLRQAFDRVPVADNHVLASRFRKMVSLYYLTKRQVSDYAELLAISPNHLNRVVKDITGKTASETIREMLVQEAKSLLQYTDSSVAEIAYQLDFSDPASFNRFFKTATSQTPLSYRAMHD